MKSLFRTFILYMSVLVSSQTMASLATTATVYMKGEQGSWVSGALGADEVLWTHGIEGLFSGDTNFDLGATITYDDGSFWRFEFAAPTYNPASNTNDGNRLTLGLYENATRFPFNSPTRPGMNISGNGRGNNRLGGWFDIREVEYDTLGILSVLAVDFRQFDESENQIGPSLFGSLRFNSDIALNYSGSPVPVPAAVWLFASGIIGMIGLGRRKKTS